MKHLIRALLLVLCVTPASGQLRLDTLPSWGMQYFAGRAPGHSVMPTLNHTVPGLVIPKVSGAIIYLAKGGGRAADTIAIEQRVITADGDTLWVPTTHLNMETGTLDSSGVKILTRPLHRIQIYDLSPHQMVRIRTSTLRPTAHRVRWSAQ